MTVSRRSVLTGMAGAVVAGKQAAEAIGTPLADLVQESGLAPPSPGLAFGSELVW